MAIAGGKPLLRLIVFRGIFSGRAPRVRPRLERKSKALMLSSLVLQDQQANMGLPTGYSTAKGDILMMPTLWGLWRWLQRLSQILLLILMLWPLVSRCCRIS